MICTASFDFGTAHNGECLVYGNEILHLAAISVPKDFASTKKPSSRRRTLRSRKHRKLREVWFWEQIKMLGLPVLKKIDKNNYTTWTDKKLSREFGKKGSTTIYASCALRIMILEGRIDELEDWQISKALYSLLKRRGYDSDIPWKKANDSAETDAEETAVVEGSLALYQEDLKSLGLMKKRQLPSYREAIMLKILKPRSAEIVAHQTHESESFKYSLEDLEVNNLKLDSAYFTPRRLRALEAELILSEVAKHYPDLDPLAMMYGPHKEAYAPYKKNLPRGRDSDLEGILNSKIPRFNNRCLRKCMLMPGRHTTAMDHSLPRKFVYLDKVRKLRIVDDEQVNRPLNYTEYRAFNRGAKKYWHNRRKGSYLPYKLTIKQIGNILASMNLKPASNIQAIEPASNGGKSAYCKQALSYVIRFYELGKSPAQAYEEFMEGKCHKNSSIRIKDNTDPKKGLTPADFVWLKSQSDRTWESFYLAPVNPIEVVEDRQQNHQKILEIIASERNPIVRNRLQYMHSRLAVLTKTAEQKLGKKNAIDRIAIEMCRESFSSQKSKKRHKKQHDANKKSNKEAKERYLEAFPKRKHIKNQDSDIQKLRILIGQNWTDIYTGRSYRANELHLLDIDHIVPRSQGGNDSRLNQVVTAKPFNSHGKRDLTPYEYFSTRPKHEFIAFRNRVNKSKLNNRTKKLLVSPTAKDDLEGYTDLSLTSNIAKKMQQIIYLYFGWTQPQQGGKKRVFMVGGQFVYMIRKRAQLNRLLHPDIEKKLEKCRDKKAEDKLRKKAQEKNRQDNRHHAVDALVISQCPDLLSSPLSKRYQKAMDFLKSQDVQHTIKNKIFPVAKRFPKPVLEDNLYGIKGQCYYKYQRILDLGLKKEQFEYASFKKRFHNILVNTGPGKWQKLGELASIKTRLPINLPKGFSFDPSLRKVITWYNRQISNDTPEGEKLTRLWAAYCGKLPQKKIACWEGNVDDKHFKQLVNSHGVPFAVSGKASHKGHKLHVDKDRKSLAAKAHYVFESKKDFEARCPENGITVHPGDLIKIQYKDKSKNKNPQKIWRLKSIMNNNQLNLENPQNTVEEFSPRINSLTKITKVSYSELPYPPHI